MGTNKHSKRVSVMPDVMSMILPELFFLSNAKSILGEMIKCFSESKLFASSMESIVAFVPLSVLECELLILVLPSLSLVITDLTVLYLTSQDTYLHYNIKNTFFLLFSFDIN